MHKLRGNSTSFRLNSRSRTMLWAVATTLLAGGSAQAAAVVANGSFNTPTPGAGGPQSLTTDSNGGTVPSSAADWMLFNDTAGTTTSDLEASTLVPGGTMIHITTSAFYSGISQTFPQHGPTNAFTCDWIYVVSGGVGIGSGLQALTTIDAALFKPGSWEVLNVGNQSTPADTTIVYNIGQGPAEFYVESVQVSTSHAQCKPK